MSYVPMAEVMRHFLRIEASHVKYHTRRNEILSWGSLPDEQLLERARCFANERDDTNPTLAYTIGTKKADYSSRIAYWKHESINCAEIYTCGIAPQMCHDIAAVTGNLRDFALKFSSKYSEFTCNQPLFQNDVVIIVVAQRKQGKNGTYELVDGAHRLVAICLGGVEAVEAYVGYLKNYE